MSAGEIQLAALGMQDAHLTGRPDVTYFKGVFRRHTPFAVQSFNIPFQDQQIKWGGQAICRIPYKGDLIQSMTLAVTLPPLFPYSVDYQWPVPAQTVSPQPYIYINGFGPFSTFIGVSTTFVVTSAASPPWIADAPALATNVFFSQSTSKFYFGSSVKTVSIGINDTSTMVFWGLNPQGFTSIDTINSKQVKTWVGGPTFTLTEAGWLQYSSQAVQNSFTNYLSFTGGAQILGGVVQMNSFIKIIGNSTYFTITPAGSVKFNYPGTYSFLVQPSNDGSPSSVSVSHCIYDGYYINPVIDYTYNWGVQFSGVNQRGIIPFKVTDISQYYYLTFVGSGTAMDNFSEIVLMDVCEYWSGLSSSALPDGEFADPNSTLNAPVIPVVPILGYNFVRNAFSTPVTVIRAGPNFSFFKMGLYNLYLDFSVLIAAFYPPPYQTLAFSKVVISNGTTSQTWQPGQRIGKASFTLPIEVLDITSLYNITLYLSQNSISFFTNINAFMGIKNSTIVFEYFGVATGTYNQENDFKQNGLFLKSTNNGTFSLGNRIINLSSGMNVRGSSLYISITANGNLKFSKGAIYRISVYIETTNAFIPNISLCTNTVDSSAFPGSWSVLQTVPILTVQTLGACTVDLLVDCTQNYLTNVFQVGIQFSNSFIGQTTTSLSTNSYFTIVGVDSTASNPNFTYVNSVGTYLVDSAELRIGGQTVQTLTGEMIEIYNDLIVSQENQTGLTLLTGKNDTSTVYTIPGSPGRTYYVNLPFFFYGNAELSIPICALGSHDLEVYINFKNFNSILTQPGVVPAPTSVSASIITDYVYLSEPEVDWFSRHRQDYIISQNQYLSFKLSGSLTFDMDLGGAVREIFFVIQDNSAQPYVYISDPGIGVTITLNGEDYVDASTLEYHFLRFIAPMKYYARQPDHTLHVLPICRRPQDPRPSGSVNMNRIYQKKFQLTLPTTPYLETKTLRLFAISNNILRIENGLAGIMFQ